MLVKENPVAVKPVKPLSYPVLVRAKDSGHVVLMHQSSEGVVLISSDHYPVGYYSETWMPPNNPVWEILPDGYSLTLTQNQQG